MKKSKIVWVSLLLAIIVVVSISAFTNLNQNQKISSDKQALIKYSLSKQKQIDNPVKIFDTTNFNHYEVDGFQIIGAQKYGIAVIKKESKSNYKLIRLIRFEKLIKRAPDIYIQYIDLYNKEQELIPYLVVLSLNPNLANIKMTINGKSFNKEVNANPSLSLIELSKKPYSLEYLFYDSIGNPISYSTSS